MAQLPPKIPTNWTNFPPHKAPSMNSFIPTATQPSWIEEFLDFSSAKRGSHRRSVSDSIAFLEPPMVEQCHTSTSRPTHDFDRLDEEQLMSMFSDDIAGGSTPPETAIQHRPPPSPVNSSSNPSTASDRDSINEPSVAAPADSNDKPAAPARERQTAGEPEVQSACELNVQAGAGSPPLTVTADPIIDPKRVKRILANRQSAQRSRVRKLQYISELERSVTSLQTEVSALSPRVAFLDHQRLVLNVDNGALKQRIAALAQDKIFKDAHQEVLRKEIERLRRVYQQQSLNNVNGCK